MPSDNLPDDNPFAPPTVQSLPIVKSQGLSFRGLMISWMLVFLLNLPLPFMWGLEVTDNAGVPGMILGCLVVSLTGIWLCGIAPGFMLRLCVGAVPIAVSQFMPMLQMFAGSAAMFATGSIFHGIADGPGANMTGIGEVAFCTILTGLELILLSLAIGYLAGFVFGLPTAPAARSRR